MTDAVRTSDASQPLCLSVQGLVGHYGENLALHGIHLEVRKGEVVCLLGRNGAGKTTTLRAVIGLLTKRQGKIEINGQPAPACCPRRSRAWAWPIAPKSAASSPA